MVTKQIASKSYKKESKNIAFELGYNKLVPQLEAIIDNCIFESDITRYLITWRKLEKEIVNEKKTRTFNLAW